MDLDVTFLFQFGILFLLVTLLGQFVLRPFQKVLDARDAQIRGADSEAHELERIGNSAMEKYQAQLRVAQAQAFTAQQKAREAGRDEERKILGATRDEVSAKINKGRGNIADEERDNRQKLAQETEALARRAVERVLGREVNVS